MRATAPACDQASGGSDILALTRENWSRWRHHVPVATALTDRRLRLSMLSISQIRLQIEATEA